MMTPPHWQVKVQLLVRDGFPPIMTVGDPGVHGAVVTGMQGCGVRTPWAAVVAAATCGLLSVVHIPNGMIFTMGALSLMVAAGWLDTITLAIGRTESVEGATPKEHESIALLHTICAISLSSLIS
jgi:hypothetical protein